MANNTLTRAAAGCLLVLGLGSGGGQAPSGPPRDSGGVSCSDPKALCDQVWRLAATVNQLQCDIGRLKQDLVLAQLDLQHGRVAKRRSELQQITVARGRLDERETTCLQEIQEIEEHLQRKDLTGEERAQAEEARADLAGPRLQEIEAERAALLVQIDEVSRQVEHEQLRLSEVEGAAREVSVARDRP